MRVIKYLMFLILAVAVVEASYHWLDLNPKTHLVLAGIFLVYGVGRLWLFTWDAVPSSVGTLRSWLKLTGRRLYLNLVIRGSYIIVFRIAFIFCSLAYGAQ